MMDATIGRFKNISAHGQLIIITALACEARYLVMRFQLWWFEVKGRGGKEALLPVSTKLLDRIKAYREVVCKIIYY